MLDYMTSTIIFFGALVVSQTLARMAHQVLTPEQKPKYAALVAQAATRQASRGRIYLLGDDGKPVAFNVRLGITDGTSTELIVPPGSPDAGVLKEGAVVITGTITPGAPAQPARPATTGPRMPF